jgi:hypothetical protein
MQHRFRTSRISVVDACGDLLRAVQLAEDELKSWAGYEASFRVAIDFKGGLGQTSSDLASLAELHPDDLARIGDLTVLVEPSREAWEKEYDARRERGEEPPAISSANVRFRLWS